MFFFKKSDTYMVSPRLQKTFIVAAAVAFSFELVFLIVNLSRFAGSTEAISYLSFVVMTLFPLLLFLVAYGLNPKKLPTLSKIFEGILIAVIGLGFFGVVNQLFNELYSALVTTGSGYTERIVYALAAYIFTLTVFSGTLLYLRKTQQWK